MGIDSFEQIANKTVQQVTERTYDHGTAPRVIVSSVVDVNAASKEEALRLSNTILAAMNGRDRLEHARCDFLFYEQEGRVRFLLWGSPGFTSTMMGMFDAIA